jgi:hypothetical protein
LNELSQPNSHEKSISRQPQPVSRKVQNKP